MESTFARRVGLCFSLALLGGVAQAAAEADLFSGGGALKDFVDRARTQDVSVPAGKPVALTGVSSRCANRTGADIAASSDFEIVESVPTETVYGSLETTRPTDVWPAMIRAARKTLDIEAFYINDIGAMKPVLDEIKAAAGCGVAVRVIVDSKFYKKMPAVPDMLKTVPGIEVRSVSMPGVQHTKFFVVDGREVFVGSQNMDGLALTQIHEIGVKVSNAAMAETFLGVFEYDWSLAAEQAGGAPAHWTPILPSGPLNSSHPVSIAGAKMYPVFSPPSLLGPGYESEIDALFRLLRSAQKSVHIQVMNYGTSLYGNNSTVWTDLDDEIKAAAGRGVQVSMAVADWTFANKIDAENLERLSSVANIKLKYSKIPQASTGFMPYSRVDHSKYMTVDGRISWISTSNWQKDYFYSSRDATIVVESADVAQKLDGVFNATWNGPYVHDISAHTIVEAPEIGAPNKTVP